MNRIHEKISFENLSPILLSVVQQQALFHCSVGKSLWNANASHDELVYFSGKQDLWRQLNYFVSSVKPLMMLLKKVKILPLPFGLQKLNECLAQETKRLASNC